MREWKRHPLGVLIKQTTGLGIQAFVEQKLNDNYPAFAYRLKNNVLRLKEYHSICFYTGLSFEELFPNPLKPIARRIPINLGDPGQIIPRRHTLILPQPPQGFTSVPAGSQPAPSVSPFSAEPESNEKGPALQPVPDSKGFIDPFEGQLPPMD